MSIQERSTDLYRGRASHEVTLAKYTVGRQVMIVTNETVARQFNLSARLKKAQLRQWCCLIGERYKTWETCSRF
jgi:3-dehydroquinate synthetase